MLFDTHAHLDDEQFDCDRELLIDSLKDSDVGIVMTVGCDMKSSRAAIELAEKYDFIYAAVGVHPHDSDKMTEDDIDILTKMASHPKVKAIGEIGLDYYYDDAIKDCQKKWFARQIQLARNVNLPIIVHNRDAHEDTMKILKDNHGELVGGVIHCFSGSAEMSREIFKMGFYISVGGTLTFKNSVRVKDVLIGAPMDRVLIETDCPYLTPEPNRGKRNNPAYIKFVAEKIAELKQMDYEDVVSATEENGKKLFRI